MRVKNRELTRYPWSSILLFFNFDSRYFANVPNGDLLLKWGWDEDWLNCYSYLWLNPLIISFLYCFVIVIVDRIWTTKFLPLILILNIFLEIKYATLTNLILIENEHYWIRNQLLLNNLNRYHPAFFFLAVGWTAGSYFNIQFSMLNRKRGWRGFVLYWHYRNGRWQWWIISWMLLLGGWWAYQEGNWGGWWNWDPSEFLALILGIQLLLISHVSRNFSFSFGALRQGRELIQLITILFLFIQLNFELTSHNFGVRSLPTFDSNVNFISLTIIAGFTQITLFSLWYHSFSFFRLRLEMFYRQVELSKRYLWWAIVAICAYYTHFSCNFILNYFFWFSCGMNFPFISQTILSANLDVFVMLSFLLIRICEGGYVNGTVFLLWGIFPPLINVYRYLTFGVVSHVLALLMIVVTSSGILMEGKSYFDYGNIWIDFSWKNFEIGMMFTDSVTGGRMGSDMEFMNGYFYENYQRQVRHLWLKTDEISACEERCFRNTVVTRFSFDNTSTLMCISWVVIALLISIF